MSGDTFTLLAGSYVRDDGTVGLLATGSPRPKDAAKGELERLDGLGAFSAPPAAGGGETPADHPTTPEDVLAWMQAASPKVSEVLAVVGEDPAMAKAALEAEGVITGGEPRKSLAPKLEEIAAGPGGGETPAA